MKRWPHSTTSSWDDVVVKLFDKGGNIVIWPSIRYLTKALKQLNDPLCYRKLHQGPMVKYRSKYNDLIIAGYQTGLMGKSEYRALLNTVSVTPTFYMLPKVHKNISKPPGRPIVSDQNDYKLHKFVTNFPSYIRDTRDLLQKLEQVNSDTFLVGCNVESLYSCNLHKHGLQATRFFMNRE